MWYLPYHSDFIFSGEVRWRIQLLATLSNIHVHQAHELKTATRIHSLHAHQHNINYVMRTNVPYTDVAKKHHHTALQKANFHTPHVHEYFPQMYSRGSVTDYRSSLSTDIRSGIVVGSWNQHRGAVTRFSTHRPKLHIRFGLFTLSQVSYTE